jgi:hypothetical protein
LTPERVVVLFAIFAAMPFTAGVCHGQCEPRWVQAGLSPGIHAAPLGQDQRVDAISPLSDGTAVLSGVFTLVSNEPDVSLVRFDPTSGAVLPFEMPSLLTESRRVRVFERPNGELVAFGDMRFDGRQVSLLRRSPDGNWSTFGSSEFELHDESGAAFKAFPDGAAVTTSGDLIVYGNFDTVFGTPARFVARWDGSVWHELIDGLDRFPDQIEPAPGGAVYAFSSFFTSAHPELGAFAVWTPQSNAWRVVDPCPPEFGFATGFLALPNGDVCVGGTEQYCLWDHASESWMLLGNGFSGGRPIASLPDGSILAADFGTSDSHANRLFRWNVRTREWTEFSEVFVPEAFTDDPGISSSARLSDGRTLAAGAFDSIGNTPMHGMTLLSDSGARSTATGPDGEVRRVVPLPGGDVLIAGRFRSVSGQPSNYIARWRSGSNTWEPLPGLYSTGTIGARVTDVAELPGGDILATGAFRLAADEQAAVLNIARRDRVTGTWRSMTPPGVPQGEINALLVLPNGDVVVSGPFGNFAGVAGASWIARWRADSGEWSPMGSGLRGPVSTFAISHSGALLAGGTFNTSNNVLIRGLGRWDEAAGTWATVGAGVSGSVQQVVPLSDGRCFVRGSFTHPEDPTVRNLALVDPDSGAWVGIPPPPDAPVNFASNFVAAFSPQSDRLIFAGRQSGAGGSFTPIFEWDLSNNEWINSGSGPENAQSLPSGGWGARAVGVTRAGDLIVGGTFFSAGGVPSDYIVRRTSLPSCSSDFDCSGQVAVDDLVSFLTAWFGQFGIADGALSADFNRDLFVGVDDLFAYIDAWMSQFAQCP